jgi:hypothetical protein
VRIEKLKSLIIRAFCAYAAAITALRWHGRGILAGGFVEAFAYRSAFTTVGGYLFMAMPPAIALLAAKTKLSEASRKATLCFSFCALLNHALFLVLMAPGLMLAHPPISKDVLTGFCSDFFLSAFMLALCVYLRRLGKLREMAGEKRSGNMAACFLAVAGLFLASAMATSYPSDVSRKLSSSAIGGWFPTSIALKDCTKLPSGSSEIAASPDGRRIAFGGRGELSVWDAPSRAMLLGDDTLHMRAARFSASGKYLAAAGTAASREYSCVALYDMERLEREPLVVRLPDQTPKKASRVLDVAFKPGERSIVYVYYNYWDRSSFDFEGWKELSERENFTDPVSWVPIFEEMEIASGRVIFSKSLGGLSLKEAEIDSLKISPDGSVLAHLQRTEESAPSPYAMRNFVLRDTATWEARTIEQDPSYSLNSASSYLLDRIGEGKIYFSYKKIDEYRTGSGNPHFYESDRAAGQWDIAENASKDLVSIASGLGLSDKSIGRPMISPNGKNLAFLSRESVKGSGFNLIIVDLSGRKEAAVKRVKIKKDFIDPLISRLAWLGDSKVVLIINAANLRPVFYYLDLTEEVGVE